MSRRHARGTAITVMVLALTLALATAAPARIIERERYSFSDTFTEEFCGLHLRFESEVSGIFTIRETKKDRQTFFGADVFEFREVTTNLDNGRWAVAYGRGNFRELRATHIEGDIYLFRAQLAGQHLVIEDSEGNVVYRDRGLIVVEALFDTLGDGAPGGELLSFEIIEIRGHPGYREDLCPLVHELLG